ncbi:MAG: hypothetical protein IPI35_34220 [Deltaproteobacteria bacterium]|nr:hypothetical protein [Deltaproteobacteria bacterium]
MNVITPDSLGEFSARFGDCHDALVKSLSVSLGHREPVCEVVLEAIDLESPSSWSVVTFRMDGFKGIHFDRRSHAPEAIFGLRIFFLGDEVRLYIDGHPNGEEMLELSESLAYVIGNRISWDAAFIP